MKDIVYNFKTKYKEGFVNSELEELLKLFPKADKNKFIKSFVCNTCMVIDDEIIHYQEDVYYSLLNSLKK